MKPENNNFLIRSVAFKEKFRCFKKKKSISFRPGINLLVGDQGCGKSSLFHAMMHMEEANAIVDYAPNAKYKFFDSESMNPRMRESFEAHRDLKPGEYEKAAIEHAVNRKVGGFNTKSHGQIMLPTVMAHENLEGYALFLDEPESGLSLRSQYKLLDYLKTASEKNQLIVATHSLILMQGVAEVLSLEHNKWMATEEFIKTQSN